VEKEKHFMKIRLILVVFAVLTLSSTLFASDIFEAIGAGKIDEVEKFLAKTPGSINHKNEKGFSPLQFSLLKKQPKIAEMLLEKGAELNFQNPVNGLAPLHFAVGNDYSDLVNLLLDKGADVNIKSKEGLTPLHTASQRGLVNMIELLIKKGADIAAESKSMAYPLHFGASQLDPKILDSLILAKMDLSRAENDIGWAPLMVAASFGNEPGFQFLLKKGAKATGMDKKKNTFLHHAVNGGNIKIIEYLLEQKADVNAKNEQGRTPLHIACGGDTLSFSSLKEENRVEVIKVLLKVGADKRLKDPSGKEPLTIAIEKGFGKVAALFADAGVKSDEKELGKICEGFRRKIGGAVEMWNMDNEQKITTALEFSSLIKNSYLKEEPKCPAGGKYSISGEMTHVGQIECSIHGK
jgi:ankyrin repeat protein